MLLIVQQLQIPASTGEDGEGAQTSGTEGGGETSEGRLAGDSTHQGSSASASSDFSTITYREYWFLVLERNFGAGNGVAGAGSRFECLVEKLEGVDAQIEFKDPADCLRDTGVQVLRLSNNDWVEQEPSAAEEEPPASGGEGGSGETLWQHSGLGSCKFFQPRGEVCRSGYKIWSKTIFRTQFPRKNRRIRGVCYLSDPNQAKYLRLSFLRMKKSNGDKDAQNNGNKEIVASYDEHRNLFPFHSEVVYNTAVVPSFSFDIPDGNNASYSQYGSPGGSSVGGGGHAGPGVWQIDELIPECGWNLMGI